MPVRGLTPIEEPFPRRCRVKRWYRLKGSLTSNPLVQEKMTTVVALPRIIQGGMGVAVSNWKLARAVSLMGQLGVISGTALDTVLARRLQDGDIGGHMRRGIRSFPIAGVADEVLNRYFRPEGRRPDEPYKLIPMYKQRMSVGRQQLTMLANFVEVYLAKEDQSGPVGISQRRIVEDGREEVVQPAAKCEHRLPDVNDSPC